MTSNPIKIIVKALTSIKNDARGRLKLTNDFNNFKLTKRGGFPMYKGFKKYFSNGAGGVQSHASAKAATVNAPRTETTTKAAEYTKAPRQGLSRGSANSQNLDKTKTVATQKANLTSALEKGNLNITGGAYYGLDKNGDGTYSGGLQFNYSGSSTVKFEDSNLIIQIPEPLRSLFKKINESGSWGKYFNGNGNFNTGPMEKIWTYKNEDFSYDGTNLILKNGKAISLNGYKKTTIFLNFNLGQAVNDFGEAIPDSTDNYLFKTALVDPGNPIDWDLIGNDAGSYALGTNHIMYRP